MSRGKIKEWDIVRINDSGDIYMETSKRDWIGQEGVVRQIFKSGLYLVHLKSGLDIRIAKKNLDLVKAYDPKESPFSIWRNEDIAS